MVEDYGTIIMKMLNVKVFAIIYVEQSAVVFVIVVVIVVAAIILVVAIVNAVMIVPDGYVMIVVVNVVFNIIWFVNSYNS